MTHAPSDRAKDLATQVSAFMETHVYKAEKPYKDHSRPPPTAGRSPR